MDECLFRLLLFNFSPPWHYSGSAVAALASGCRCAPQTGANIQPSPNRWATALLQLQVFYIQMYLYSQPPPALYSQLPGNHRSSHNFHHRTPGGQVHGSRKTELKFTLSPSDVQQDEQADTGQAEQHLWSRSPPRSFSVGPCSGAHDEESKLRSEPKSESESEDGRRWWWEWGGRLRSHTLAGFAQQPLKKQS